MGQTQLHLATQTSHNKGIVELLLKSGVDANARDNYNRTPFHLVSSGHMIKPQLDAGAKVSLLDSVARTPLHYAADRRDGNQDSVDLLLRSGADINVPDNNGQTPLHLMASRDLIESVLDAKLNTIPMSPC